MEKLFKQFKQHLKKRKAASALFLAIIVSFIITVNISAIFLLTVYQRQYATDNLKVKKLTHIIDEGITFVLKNYESFDYNNPYSVDLFGEQTDSLTFVKKYWGWYDLVNMTTADGKDSLHKNILIGSAALPKEQRIALYIANRLEHININNDSYVKGNMFLPYKGYKSKNGLGKSILPDLSAESSTSALPVLRGDRLHYFSTILQKIKTDKNTVSTLLSHKLQTTEQIIDCSNGKIPSEMNGSTILYSSNTLIINPDNALKNVIIYAPSVVVRSGFKGDFQLFCTDSIIIEDHCTLNYPSAVTLIKQSNDVLKSIKIGQYCAINGAIIAVDEAIGLQPCKVRIGDQSIVRGIIYCMGMLENHAKIYGTLMSAEVTDGVLINDLGTIWIDAKALPEIYGDVMLFTSNKKYEFIK